MAIPRQIDFGNLEVGLLQILLRSDDIFPFWLKASQLDPIHPVCDPAKLFNMNPSMPEKTTKTVKMAIFPRVRFENGYHVTFRPNDELQVLRLEDANWSRVLDEKPWILAARHSTDLSPHGYVYYMVTAIISLPHAEQTTLWNLNSYSYETHHLAE